jgi:hypothetical protein
LKSLKLVNTIQIPYAPSCIWSSWVFQSRIMWYQYFNFLSNFHNYVSECCICRILFFKFIIIEKLFDIGKVTRKVQGSSHFIHLEVIIGHIDVDTIIIDFAYLNCSKNCFIWIFYHKKWFLKIQILKLFIVSLA